MSIPIPLSVRLKTSRTDRFVTKDLRDLQFRTVIPGGFASCTVSLNRPLSLQPDEIAYYGNLYVYDRRNNSVVWEGRVEDLGRNAGTNGQVWDISALGPSAHAEDITRPYVILDKQYGEFRPSTINRRGAFWQPTNEEDNTTTGIRCALPQGTDAPALTKYGDSIYLPIYLAGQKIARVVVSVTIGFTDAGWATEIITKTGPTGTLNIGDQFIGPGSGTPPFSTTLVAALSSDGGNVTNGHDVFTFRADHISSSGNVTTDDKCWFEFNNYYVKTIRYLQDGTEKTTGYSGTTVMSDQIVADMLVRFLPKYDAANAALTAGTYSIDQFANYDGNTPRKYLDDLMVLEPTYYWAAWESGSTGLYRFEWSQWPTTVTYDADVKDGFDAPGPAVDLYNAVRVRFKATSGTIKNLQRTSTVATLTNAGLSREGFIDLGDNIASTNAAQQAGDQFLAEHAVPPNAGQLTVARPIVNLVSGRMVQPWEIRPGNLIRVRGVLPRVDALNPTGRDGTTIFRVKAVDYRASTASAQLELDAYPVATQQALATASRKPVIRRR